ncbi:hypothetical protein T265_15402, partial [Opisthorchis viverrini]
MKSKERNQKLSNGRPDTASTINNPSHCSLGARAPELRILTDITSYYSTNQYSRPTNKESGKSHHQTINIFRVTGRKTIC